MTYASSKCSAPEDAPFRLRNGLRFIRGSWVNELKESNMAEQEQECKQTDVDKGIVVCALVNEVINNSRSGLYFIVTL